MKSDIKKKVYLSLGSNLGNRIENLEKAYEQIETHISPILEKSAFYRTPPWGFESGEDFVNSVVGFETALDASALLNEIRKIESELGRKRAAGKGYQDRIIDLDIIDYNGEVIETKDLIVPHKHMHERNFVIYPLEEVAPKWRHPLIQKEIGELKEEVPNIPPIEKLS